MPRQLKIRTTGTDARAMSETALTPPNEMTPPFTPEGMILDGDAPRLGSAPMAAPAPMGGTGTPVTNDSAASPLPVVSPVLSDPDAPMHTSAEAAPAPALPSLVPAEAAPALAEAAPAVPSLPTLPTAAPAAPAGDPSEVDETAAPAQGDAEHPMAHLMGGKSAPSEASRRAAEVRAAKKAKAKKVKTLVAIGAVVVSAAAGPPLWSWFTNALDEAGDTSYDEPAD